MSSFNNGGVINRKKGSIVLFQHGIFGNEDSFTEAIAKLVKQAPNRHIAFPDTFINMNSFKKMGYNNTYLFETPESQLEFNDTIKNIALFAKDHPNHNILVRTRVSGINKAD